MTRAEVFSGTGQEWDAAVAVLPGATASHLYGWKRVISRVYGHECPYMVTRDSNGISGALPLVDVRSLAFGRFLVSMPYLNSGGPIGSTSAVRELTSAAVALAAARRARMLEFRCLSELPVDLPYSNEKVGTAMVLPPTADELWKRFSTKLRTKIRRPQKDGMHVVFGPEQIEPFFRVFARNMRDLGSPTHPISLFETIAEELPGSALFGCALLNGKPVAAGCAISWRDEMEMTWASSLREWNALKPNMLLYWNFMERAVSSGYTRFSFGRSTPGGGTHEFKLQWPGAADVPLYWHRWSAKPQAVAPGKDSSSLALASRLWQRMPVPLATALGGKLRGGIPA